MSYIIKDVNGKYWLSIDRAINNMTCDITTIVEPVHCYKAATKFDSVEECSNIMKEIQAESNYDIPVYAVDNYEELVEAEKKAEQDKKEEFRKKAQDALDKVVNDCKAKGMSDDEIREVLSKGIRVTEETKE